MKSSKLGIKSLKRQAAPVWAAKRFNLNTFALVN